MKLVKTALVAALFSTATFTAQADTFNLGDVTYEPIWGAAHDGTGVFEDQINFTLSKDAGVSTYLTNFSFDTANNMITNFMGTLSEESMGVISFWTFNEPKVMGSMNLGAGNYTLSLSGDFGGSGTYDFDAVAAPVPEPSVLGLMFGGLGLVGLMAYRARKA